eukprot:TRINITY_DN1350_c0_g2_i1.p1 TRINITY_DN1350_c0_g2~~TRINITY_DN1350_c0_g2_i1.p1  ORF type:complete len:1173 (+),score=355.70 TRINITY_DN1350_c0_g2_i1:112-3630(+)
MAMTGSYEQGLLVWVSDPESVFKPGRVVSSSEAEVLVELDTCEPGDPDGCGGGERLSVPLSEAAVATPTKGQKGVAPRRLLRRNLGLLGDGAVRFDDLTDVPELHEAAVLHALDRRFQHGVIYTLSGPVLLAVNPFRMLPGLYGPEVLRSFLNVDRPKPHVFGVAGQAFRNICERNASQTVLVSGESGSGKTETTKFVMQFLALAGAETAAIGEPEGAAAAAAAGSQRGSTKLDTDESTTVPMRRLSFSDGSEKDGGGEEVARAAAAAAATCRMSRIERQVLGSNPLLEAFGNAKTLRNDNSSRFGKYIELQFGEENFGKARRLAGARIRTYLLEKVRVIHQQDGEQSFHIFYQALAAAQAQLSSPWQQQGETFVDLYGFSGGPPSSFAYLEKPGGAGSSEFLTGDLVEEFEATLASMRSVGLGVKEASDIFRMLAAVLQLGELEFFEPTSENSKVCPGRKGADVSEQEDEMSQFELVCDLLGVTTASLERALCFRTMQAAGDNVIHKPNNTTKAAETRDALSRHLYGTIFQYLVERTNQSIGFQSDAVFCGVLDIFGFEFFQTNSFEQLCINYTNELLQQYFNQFIFENEAALYREEGIKWDPQNFPDNAPIVALLQDKLTGVLPMLEEEGFTVGGSSEAWCNKVIREHANHKNFQQIKQRQGVFIVDHFAGPVTYTAAGFLEKNRDQLSQDLLKCLENSDQPFIQERFAEHSRSFGAGGTTPGATPVKRPDPRRMAASPKDGVVKKAQRYSVSSEFRTQLQELLSQIHTTTPHFIRCIKSNPKNQPFVTPTPPGRKTPLPWLERKSVSEQLRYQGVLEAIRVARAGYPVRFIHLDFVVEFRCLSTSTLRRELDSEVRRRTKSDDAAQEDCLHLLKKLLDCEEVQALLQRTVEDGVEGWAVGRSRIFLKQEPHALLRSALAQKRHVAAREIQSRHRGHSVRKAKGRFMWALLRLQARCRGRRTRQELRRQREEAAAVCIQATLRTLIADIRRTHVVAAATKLQSQVRMRIAIKLKQHGLSEAKRLQTWWRSLIKRRRWRTLQARVLKIQRLWRGSRGRKRFVEVQVQAFRRKIACRHLVRVRRRRLAYRAWRADIMRMYKGETHAAPPKEDLIKELLGLQEDYGKKKKEVDALKEEVSELGSKVEVLWNHACVRLRSLFSAPVAVPQLRHR